MSQLMDEILRKVRQLSASEQRQLLGMLSSKADLSENDLTTPAAQAELARSIRGKYAHVSTSSDSFNRRKHAETNLESRRTAAPSRRKS